MSSQGDLSENARLQAKNAAHSARPWMERLARLGYATEGVLYTLIDLLAAGAGSAPATTRAGSVVPWKSLREAPSAASWWV
jgi:hypothetical protein